MSQWTITASSRMDGADWTGTLLPQVVEAHSLKHALELARAIPLRQWIVDDAGQCAVTIWTDLRPGPGLPRLTCALAEIRRMRTELVPTVDHPATADYLGAVLDAAEATLRRHGQFSASGLADGDWCPADGHDYPCDDLLAVLDIYAPENGASHG